MKNKKYLIIGLIMSMSLITGCGISDFTNLKNSENENNDEITEVVTEITTEEVSEESTTTEAENYTTEIEKTESTTESVDYSQFDIISGKSYKVFGSQYALEWTDVISVNQDGSFSGTSITYGETEQTNTYEGRFNAPNEGEDLIYRINIAESSPSYWAEGTDVVLYDKGFPNMMLPEEVRDWISFSLYKQILDDTYIPCQLIYNTNDRSIYADVDYLNEHEPGNNDSSTNLTSPFYGIWCYGGKDENDAYSFAQELTSKGLDGKVFVTTDWSNLNSEKFYVVTAGTYTTEEEANNALSNVQNAGYGDAYVKYSGDYIGE
ncbi:MAG: SPOR domain-containing protein [Eubacterium sp.]|nr:SPOR domain-containing protein [Eubacterium sp.]